MLESILSSYAHAVVERCDENCRIKMLRRPRAVILKGEHLGGMHGQKMCDCVIFRDDSKIVLVELKSKNIEPGSIREKLTNGARAALEIWSEVSDKAPTLFFAVAAKSFADHAAYIRISRDRITIDKQRYAIKTTKCGSSIDEIVRMHR